MPVIRSSRKQPGLAAPEVPGVEVPLPAVVEDLHRLHLPGLGGGAAPGGVVEAQLAAFLDGPGEDAQLGGASERAFTALPRSR